MNHIALAKIASQKERFTPHEAACYWQTFFDADSPTAIYFESFFDSKEARLPDELQMLDGEDVVQYKDEYVKIRKLIKLHGLDEKGYISRNSLIYIAEQIEENPSFLFVATKAPIPLPHPEIPHGLDKSVVKRLNALHDAAELWVTITPKSDKIPLNKHIAGDIVKASGVSPTMANHMASIVRPDWAKDKSKI